MNSPMESATNSLSFVALSITLFKLPVKIFDQIVQRRCFEEVETSVTRVLKTLKLNFQEFKFKHSYCVWFLSLNFARFGNSHKFIVKLSNYSVKDKKKYFITL